MSRPSRSTRRCGDPRKRAVQARPPGTNARKRLEVVVLVIGVVFLAVAVLALRDGDREADAVARAHAESACDLTSKADEAARVWTDARYAATVLVLDQAILESARVAEADPRFADLDHALQAVHTAAHTGDLEKYEEAMDRARAACRSALD